MSGLRRSPDPLRGPEDDRGGERHLAILLGDREIARYVYRPDTPLYESPKPYLHPVRTLAGEEITLLRPHDHIWHRGFQMTSTDLSGNNFWGGGTYVPGQPEYVDLHNQSRMLHRSWNRLDADGERVVVEEVLDWVGAAGDNLLEEHRGVEFADLDRAAGSYRMRTRLDLRNVTDRTLQFSSPTVRGRPQAGYGGFFWRGPRSFHGGRVFTAEGVEAADAAMGTSAPWLAFVGQHDGPGRHSTLVFADHPGNPRYPTQWFVRSQPFACVSFAFIFDRVLDLPAGASVQFTYDVVIVDHALDSDAAGRLADRAVSAPGAIGAGTTTRQ